MLLFDVIYVILDSKIVGGYGVGDQEIFWIMVNYGVITKRL